MNKKTTCAGVIVFLLPLFAACDLMGPAPQRISEYAGKAEVLVRIDGAGIGGRTIRPAASLDEVTFWELYGGKQGEMETPLTEFSSAGGTTINLDPGTWSFTLTGYKDGGRILAGSIPEQVISLEGPNVLDFPVAPILGEPGTVNIVIELPAGSGITAARVFWDGTESPVAPLDGRITVGGDYSPGFYVFSVRLYKNDDLYGVISEAVCVWANLTSEKTYTLGLENLNAVFGITYDLGDGRTQTSAYRQTDPDIPLIVPSRVGFAFLGWYENADFSGEPVVGIPAGSVGDKAFYARWESAPQRTVTFDGGGGYPGTQTRMVNSGGSIGSGGSGGSGITNITYLGDTWTVLDDGRRRSPAIGHNSVTKARIEFISGTTNTSISIQLDVSSESGYDYAFISTLDNASATYESGYYAGGKISGSNSVTVTIPVPNPGSHFIDIGYRKDGSVNSGSDCAWFKVTDLGSGASGMPVEPEKSGFVFGGWYTARNGGGSQFTADTRVTEDIILYAWWTSSPPVQYTVTFNADGGSPVAQTRTVNRGVRLGTANMPEEPVKSGYALFGGWFTQQNGGGSRFTENTPVTSDTTVYAWWPTGGASAIRITLQPAPGDPPLSNTSLFAGQSAEFSAGSGYNSYTWYWDGVVITNVNGPAYTLGGAASQKSPGIHELSVVVADGTGARLSARCRIIIQTP
jgi:uncharacterized repeat protein (TIGR02543 family)